MEMKIQFQRCFSCRDCQRPLDPFLCCDTPDMEIVCKVLTFDIFQQVLATSTMVCKGCYAKSYSVTSEWCTMSGGDALKLLSTTTIMPGEGDSGENCPRCKVCQIPEPLWFLWFLYVGAMEKYSTTKECQRRGKRITRGKKLKEGETLQKLSRCATCKNCEKKQNISSKRI